MIKNVESISELHDAILEMDSISPAVLGASLVIAPHPDDETLGCGGTAALLLKMGLNVHFLFVSDGSMSHPNSQKFPSEKLKTLREEEARKAVETLGGKQDDVLFFELKDSLVPNRNDFQFDDAVTRMAKTITDIAPETIFVPWRKDPHKDHQATWQIVHAALESITLKPRVLEYLIWFWERGNSQDLPSIEQMKLWCIDIDETLKIKHKALAAHASQVTRLIDDDPQGFMLSEQVIAHFDIPREIFFESIT